MDLRDFFSSEILAIDTETTGLSEEDVPFGFSIANDHSDWFYDERVSDPWKSLAEFARMPRTWLLQNAKFDMRMLESKGVSLRGSIIDIAVLARILRNDHLKYNLESQAKRLGFDGKDPILQYIAEHKLHYTRKNFFGEEEKHPDFTKVPVELMFNYARRDARLTYDIYMKYKDMLDAESVELAETESRLTPVCYKMERHGVKLNLEYTMRGHYHEAEQVLRIENTYKEHTGVDYVNSAKSIQKALAFQLPQTEKGNPSLTDDVVDVILSHPSVSEKDKTTLKLVRGMRYYDKRISTYYKSYLNLMDKNHVIHPTMWQGGTRTGRFSYSDPNLQNIPKNDKDEEYQIRGCFMPREGRTFVSFDYSQMEYFLTAAYANERGVIEQIMQGEDFHQAAANMFGVSRDYAKTLNFAVLYGAGEEKIAAMLGISVIEARHLKYKYFMALPRVEKFIDKVISTGRTRGYVTNWAGRRLYADPQFCYALPNHLIQGGGADVVKKAMVEIDASFPDLMMVLQVHDQLVFEMLPEEMQYIPEIKRIMETVFPPLNDVTLKVDVEVSSKSLSKKDLVKYNATS